MKRFLASAAIVAAAAAPALATATAASAASNAGNAKQCQKHGWKSLTREDGSTFQNQGDCVSHGARRGTLGTSPAQSACLNLGGTFSSAGTNHWTCTGWPVSSQADGNTKGQSLAALCSGGIASYGPGPDFEFWDASCSPFAT